MSLSRVDFNTPVQLAYKCTTRERGYCEDAVRIPFQIAKFLEDKTSDQFNSEMINVDGQMRHPIYEITKIISYKA